MTSTEIGRGRLSRFLISLAAVSLLLIWIGICAYQSDVAGWVGSSGSQCSDPHRMGAEGAFWRVVISGVGVSALAGLSVFSRASLVKGADHWYWARAMLLFVVGELMASVLWFFSLASWYSANPDVIDSDVWQPVVRFIISGAGTAPWAIGTIACIIIGIRTSRPVARMTTAVIAAAVVLSLEVLAMATYLALLSYYCA